MLPWLKHFGLCPFKNIFGLPCPGCGMTRAFLSVLHLDVKSAFHFHPLFWLVPLIFLVVLGRKRVPLFAKLTRQRELTASLLLLFVGVYVWRLWRFFPTVAPLDFDAQAVVPTVWRWLSAALSV